MTEHEEREYVAKARAEGKTASVTRGTTTTCYHPNGCVLVFDDGLIEESPERIKARLRQVLYLVMNGIPYEIADKLNEVELAAHVEIMKEIANDPLA